MIIRGPRSTDAVALIPTAALTDGALSFKARGILAYLLALPAGTEVSPEKITRSGTDGERAVKSGLKELEDAGYLHRDGTALTITEPGVEAPTPTEHRDLVPTGPAGFPEHLRWLVETHPWLSPAAVKTAHREIVLQELPLAITRYEIRCAELKKPPTSSEWLRWTIDDEQKLILDQAKAARENSGKGHWWDVA